MKLRGKSDKRLFESRIQPSNDDPRDKLWQIERLKAQEDRVDRLGENNFLLHIVTRWKRDENGIKLVRSGQHLLEMVAIKRSRFERFWAIPEVKRYADANTKTGVPNVDTEDPESPLLIHAFSLENRRDDVTDPQYKTVLQRIKRKLKEESGSQLLYYGFMDDEDNSIKHWITVKVEMFHDDGNLFDAFELRKAHLPAVEVGWIPVHCDMDLCAEQEDLLKEVARRHGAYWGVREDDAEVDEYVPVASVANPEYLTF